MDAAGNEVWELLTPLSISRHTYIQQALQVRTYKVKTLVVAAIFWGNTVHNF